LAPTHFIRINIMTLVKAVQCKSCNDIIYSVAHHDFHYCGCGKTSVDGGFSYLRYGWDGERPDEFDLEVDATKKEMFDDWNLSHPDGHNRKYGTIKND
jgi:hypothetical protein